MNLFLEKKVVVVVSYFKNTFIDDQITQVREPAKTMRRPFCQESVGGSVKDDAGGRWSQCLEIHIPLSILTLLAGRQEERSASKNVLQLSPKVLGPSQPRGTPEIKAG